MQGVDFQTSRAGLQEVKEGRSPFVGRADWPDRSSPNTNNVSLPDNFMGQLAGVQLNVLIIV